MREFFEILREAIRLVTFQDRNDPVLRNKRKS